MWLQSYNRRQNRAQFLFANIFSKFCSIILVYVLDDIERSSHLDPNRILFCILHFVLTWTIRVNNKKLFLEVPVFDERGFIHWQKCITVGKTSGVFRGIKGCLKIEEI